MVAAFLLGSQTGWGHGLFQRLALGQRKQAAVRRLCQLPG